MYVIVWKKCLVLFIDFLKKRLGEDNPEVVISPTFKHFLKLFPSSDIMYFYIFFYSQFQDLFVKIIKKKTLVLLWWKLCYFKNLLFLSIFSNKK